MFRIQEIHWDISWWFYALWEWQMGNCSHHNPNKSKETKGSDPLRIKIWVNHQANHPGQFSSGWIKGNSRMRGEARRWWKSIRAIGLATRLGTIICFTNLLAFDLFRAITGFHLETNSMTDWTNTSSFEEYVRKFHSHKNGSSAF